MTAPTYGLVGRGRLATHLDRYLELERQRVLRWHRGFSCAPAVALAGADIVLLAIADDAVESFVAANPELCNRRLVHFSGARSFAGITGLHPLMTFGAEPYPIEVYRIIPFVAERGGASFAEIFPALGNPSAEIAVELKPLYHALCVLSGNLTTLLWSKAAADFESRLGLPAELLRPFLRQTAANTLETGSAALTGPLDRGDRGTLELDLEGLGGDPFAPVLAAAIAATGAVEVRS